MAVKSKRLRFEILKRDNFTCRYCGRRSPEVVLHVDHIIPEFEGGADEEDNLVTACQDCNLGKSARTLDERAPVFDPAERAAELRERRQRIEEYAREKALRDAELNEAYDYWFDIYGSGLAKSHIPYEYVLRDFVDALGAEEVKDAMRITSGKFAFRNARAPGYLVGVLRGKLAAAEGRITSCIYCKRRIILDPGEDVNAEWFHPACKEEQDAAEAAEKCCVCGVNTPEDGYAACDPCLNEILSAPPPTDEIALEVKAWDELAEQAGL